MEESSAEGHLEKLRGGGWPIAAEDLHSEALKFIYQTEGIKNFLKGNNQCIICGLKGLGKTLLLKAKKENFLKVPKTTQRTYVVIPNITISMALRKM